MQKRSVKKQEHPRPNVNEIALESALKRISILTAEISLKKISNMTPLELSEYYFELAMQNAYIGEFAADATAKSNWQWAHKRFRYAEEWSPMKTALGALGKATNDDVKAELDVKLKSDTYDHIKAQHLSDRLQALFEANQQIINSLAAAIRVKMGEANNRT